ncbi:MAG: DsbA family protein, partial [Xanthobacteraceae bacterium]
MLLRRLIVAASVLALVICVLAVNRLPAAAESFSAPQRSEIENIVREYLLRKPELLEEVLAELEKRRSAAEAEKAKAAVKNNATLLFNAPDQIVLGNPHGDVTVVEFFDYNCGFCKRALGDLVELIKEDPKLRVVLKEFPVLGQGSVEAAQVSLAAQLQDKDPKKYFDFHQKLLTQRGQADKARALAVAKEVGYDVARIQRDMGGDSVRAAINESLKLAEALGLNGTPSYVVGDEVVIGAVGHDALKQKVSW